MPTVDREGPYRFFFYSADRNEPPHIHVERDSQRAKFCSTRFGSRAVVGSVLRNFATSNGL